MQYPGHEGDYLEDEDLEEGQDDDDDDDALDEYQEGSELAEGKTDEGHGDFLTHTCSSCKLRSDGPVHQGEAGH